MTTVIHLEYDSYDSTVYKGHLVYIVHRLKIYNTNDNCNGVYIFHNSKFVLVFYPLRMSCLGIEIFHILLLLYIQQENNHSNYNSNYVFLS